MESIVDILFMGEKAQWVIEGVSVWAHVAVEYCIAWPTGDSQDPTRVMMECKTAGENIILFVEGGTNV